MAWTATLTSKIQDSQGRIVVMVTLTNGASTDTMTLTTDTAPAVPKWVERQVKDRVAQLDALDAWANSLPAPGAPVDFTVDTAPTAAETAAATWRADYQTLKNMNQAVTEGLITANNAQRTAQINLVKNTFIFPDYLPFLRA